MASMVIFDFAYLDYAKSYNISCPEFIIHDRLETTHYNQISAIYEICKNLDGQYILPVLKEKFISAGISSAEIDKTTILSLSENDRFFKI